MQCNTNYTGNQSNLNYINLNVLKTYKKTFPKIILGLSDHTPGHETVLGAIALGALTDYLGFKLAFGLAGSLGIIIMAPLIMNRRQAV
mgnify:CR=1 FL=1